MLIRAAIVATYAVLPIGDAIVGTDVVTIIKDLGALGFALLVIFGGQKGLYKWRGDVTELMAGKDAQIAALTQAKAEALTAKEQQMAAVVAAHTTLIAEKEEAIERERVRATRFEEMAIRLLETANRSATVATEAAKYAVGERGN